MLASSLLFADEVLPTTFGVLFISGMIVAVIWMMVNHEEVFRRNWLLRRTRQDHQPGGCAMAWMYCIGGFAIVVLVGALFQVIAASHGD